MPHEVPSRPWEQIGVDLFELNKKEFMVTVDYYSNFWEVDRLTSTTSAAIILKLKNHFARYGCPDRLISDNGPQFISSEFTRFAKEWNFEHRTNSPGNSKANGKVESAVKTAKKSYPESPGFQNGPVHCDTRLSQHTDPRNGVKPGTALK